ncbi:uncharacterized protein TNCV_2968031 [Trichonephila clavipes]|nr:uncharacterized protein TNCV_2968031 [Trichonephila clavipes]
MFSRHAKHPVKTWRDFYFDLQIYFDGWLKESKVTTLEELKNLIVADQIKKKAPQDYKDHFLDQWCNWNNPLQLVDKLDSYEEVMAAVAEWYMYRTVACLVTSSSPVPLKTRRVGQRGTLNLSRAEMSSRWCGVVVRRGGASSGVVHVT